MRPNPDILLIAGMREAGAFAMPDGVDCLSLPAYAKAADGTYHARDLASGSRPCATCARRPSAQRSRSSSRT
jgi:predicted glycosyltransferase